MKTAIQAHSHAQAVLRPAKTGARRAGSALLMVLWAILILSAAVFGMIKWTYQDLELYNESNWGLEALAMAHSGIEVALNPAVNKNTPMLEEELRSGVGYSVKMVSEGGKLNINWLIQGEDPNKLAILKLWLRGRGLDFQQTEIFVDSLLDYVDPDNIHRINGVEDQGDYHPPNRGRLISVDEIEQVYGAEPLTKTPGWRDQLTVFSQGPIDLVSAPLEILRLIPGLGETRIQRLLILRKGRDGVEGTIDDPELDQQTLQRELGLPPQAWAQLNAYATVNDKTMHITSVGRSGKVVRQVEVVAVKSNGPNSTIRSWKE